MAGKTIFRRRRANDDIDAALTYYLREAGSDVALDFIDELDATLKKISKGPTVGSMRYSHELKIPGLRFRQMKRFPYLVFYLELEGRIEIARVLHSNMNIPARLHEDQ